MADEELKRLAHADYWDERYSGVGPDQRVHEWFRSFGDLEGFFDRNLFQKRAPETSPRILHLGSGDSTIPQDLAERGYTSQVCVDFSTAAVELMSKRHANIEGIQWKQMDVRHMDSISSQSIDFAFDKGTLDAMIHGSPWSPPPEVLDNTGQYLKEVLRVLKPDGAFLYITYRQPHFIKPLLQREGLDWEIQIEPLGGSDSSFGYYGFICQPKKENGD
ncbi:S-adenosyl-L-methionine-dependent methyltransferase [Hypoxylon rubiginosum]|uniref:S-adenosyl-L-methionine-dependent methyltransferase n=1 Tax=Hypoxylon rubiginosum TaxID=110542 RepID=A0ACC0CRL2_9PEZI|nr:S-adenosyl-L-methionine-dependent methyltransferase [Hypoxylon rubiginosum]